MTKRLRLSAIALVAFLVFGVVVALVSTTWHGSLNTPPNLPTRNVSFKCGPLLGADYVRGPSTTAYPVAGTPCGSRHSDQVMVAIDILLAVIGIGVVVRLGRGRSGESYSDAMPAALG